MFDDIQNARKIMSKLQWQVNRANISNMSFGITWRIIECYQLLSIKQ